MPTLPTTAAISVMLLLTAVLGSAMLLQRDGAAEPRQLRVCADPNNLPFTDAQGSGFENRIAEILAEELDAQLTYTWWSQRLGFIRNTLRAGDCDVVMGVPYSYELVLASEPYYRSTYVFLTRADRGSIVESLDDPVLRDLTIGVPLLGDDGANPPPLHALATRGLTQRVSGYSALVDRSSGEARAPLVDAVASGEVDVAILWGPQAGYFAARQPVALQLTPVTPQVDVPFLPFVYDVSLGVRRADTLLLRELEGALAARATDIRNVLRQYGVPEVRR